VKVTVFGATGQLGQVTVPQLVTAGHQVTAVVRRVDRLATVGEQGAAGVLGDLEGGEHADLGPALTGAEAVVWVAGANFVTGPEHSDRVDRDGALRAIDAAAAAGVGRWVQVSSLYANRWEAAPTGLQHFLRNKQAADEALKVSGMGWTILRPGGLSNDPPTGKVRTAQQLDSRGGITRSDVGAFIVGLLDTGAGLDAEFDMGNDDTITIKDAIAAL
jgi:uncharacterized protein YbjT (DUF2867 family)